MSKPFLTAEWRALVMLNYAVEERALRPLVPDGTELDTWDGVAFADMADFTGDGAGFYGTRFANALSAAPHSAFLAEGSPVEVMRGVLLARPHE